MTHLYKSLKTGVLALVALLFALPAFAQETVNVTFRFNAATVYDTVSTNYKVFINGNIKGQGAPADGEQPAFVGGEILDWSSSGTALLTNVGGDYWEGTFQMFAGDTVLYKYRVAAPSDPGLDQDEYGFDEVLTPIEGWDTRMFVASSTDTVLIEEFFNNIGNNSAYENSRPFQTDEDSVTVWFRVNVGHLVQSGDFDPVEGRVGVRGTPEIIGNPSDWGTAGFYLSKEDVPDYGKSIEGEGIDLFYSGALKVHRDSVNGQTVAFKFVPEKTDGAALWEDGDNREFILPNQDSTLQWVYHNNIAPTAGQLYNSDLEFRVNMSAMQRFGLFDPNLDDKVVARGGPFGWGTSAENTMTEDPLSGDYTTSYAATHTEGTEYKYKYYVEYGPSRTDLNSENYLEVVDISDDFGYEEPAGTGGADRSYIFTTEPSQTTGQLYFNDIDFAGIVRSDMQVTFEVDMSAALSHSTPFVPSEDSVYLMSWSRVLNFTQGFDFYTYNSQSIQLKTNVTSEELEVIRFKEVEGEDNIYRLTLNLNGEFPNDFGYNIGYGTPSTANLKNVNDGSGTSAGRRYYQFVRPLEVVQGTDDFGNPFFESTFPESVSLERVVWAARDLPFETPPNYEAISTDIGDELAELPNNFRLEQNYPNPFNPTTNIAFNLPSASEVTLEVYNMLGQRVATLLNRQLTAGAHNVPFNAANLSSGIYIYRLKAGNFVDTKRMTLIK